MRTNHIEHTIFVYRCPEHGYFCCYMLPTVHICPQCHKTGRHAATLEPAAFVSSLLNADGKERESIFEDF